MSLPAATLWTAWADVKQRQPPECSASRPQHSAVASSPRCHAAWPCEWISFDQLVDDSALEDAQQHLVVRRGAAASTAAGKVPDSKAPRPRQEDLCCRFLELSSSSRASMRIGSEAAAKAVDVQICLCCHRSGVSTSSGMLLHLSFTTLPASTGLSRCSRLCSAHNLGSHILRPTGGFYSISSTFKIL